MALRYRFDDYELRPAEHRLLRGGVDVPLTARATALLLALVERAGELRSRDDLMSRVWGGRVVEENNLAVQVGALRRALGPEAISNIPGMGYRFTREVTVLAPPEASTDVSADAAGGGAGGPGEPAAVPGNLPARAAPLIGRDAPLDALSALVATQPLITIHGGPGLGKTSLARALALRERAGGRFPDGVFWVDLVPVAVDVEGVDAQADAIAAAIARALDLKTPLSAGDRPAALARRLRHLALLLVLDNAEHLLEAVARIAHGLVGETARLALVVTSQVPLQGGIERLFRLEPLALPPLGSAPTQARASAAWQLFAACAARADAPLRDDDTAAEAAAAICRQLDGNPLAIELAAARLPALGLDGLAARLGQRLALLAPSPPVQPSRGNALAIAMDWSHELLSPQERRVFRRLGVFPHTFTLEAAVRVAAEPGPQGADDATRDAATVLALVARSLVAVAAHGDTPRYRLTETSRLYAIAQLDAAGETAATRAAFRAAMIQLLAQAEAAWWSERRESWRARLAPEIDNVRAALASAVAEDLPAALALFAVAWPVHDALALQSEARPLGEALVHRLSQGLPEQPPRPLQARVWYALARLLSQDYPQRARDAAERAAALAREDGDARLECLALSEYAFNWRVAHPRATEALARARALVAPAFEPMVHVRYLNADALMHLLAGDWPAARAGHRAIAALAARLGSREVSDTAMLNLADMERAAGCVDEAVRLGELLAERMRDDAPSSNLATAMSNLVGALAALGDDAATARAFAVGRDCFRRLGHRAADTCLWSAMDAPALLHARSGRLALAARLAGASDRAYRDHGQHHRQPNEAADRAALEALLADALPAEERLRLQAEGEGLDIDDAMALAFDSAVEDG